MRKPFLWKERKVWCVRIPIDGKLKLVRLGPTRKVAYDRWNEMKRQAKANGSFGCRTVSDLIEMFAAHQMKRLEKEEISELHTTFQLGLLTTSRQRGLRVS